MVIKNQEQWDKSYDKSRSSYLLTDFLYEIIFKKFKFYKRVNRYTKILDIGCGDCKVLKFLNKKGYLNLHGFDLRKYYIGNKNIELKQGNMFSMPYENNSLSVLLCFNVMHHCTTHEEYRIFLDECKRILKQDGEIFLLEPHNTIIRKINKFFCSLPILKHIGILKHKRIIFQQEEKEHQMFFDLNLVDYLKKNGFKIKYTEKFIEGILIYLRR
ncbi:MAG: class I SAM-dependent methyltransferase [Candidatus Thorarchaeota archaeon]